MKRRFAFALVASTLLVVSVIDAPSGTFRSFLQPIVLFPGAIVVAPFWPAGVHSSGLDASRVDFAFRAIYVASGVVWTLLGFAVSQFFAKGMYRRSQ